MEVPVSLAVDVDPGGGDGECEDQRAYDAAYDDPG